MNRMTPWPISPGGSFFPTFLTSSHHPCSESLLGCNILCRVPSRFLRETPAKSGENRNEGGFIKRSKYLQEHGGKHVTKFSANLKPSSPNMCIQQQRTATILDKALSAPKLQWSRDFISFPNLGWQTCNFSR